MLQRNQPVLVYVSDSNLNATLIHTRHRPKGIMWQW